MDTIHINSLPPLHQRMIVDWRLWTGPFLKKNLTYASNLNLAKPRAPFCLIQSALCPVPCCAQPSYALVFEFWSFWSHSTNLLLLCLSVGSLTCHQPMRFSFRYFTSFFEIFEIFWDFTRFYIFFIFTFKFQGEEPYLYFMEPKYMF